MNEFDCRNASDFDFFLLHNTHEDLFCVTSKKVLIILAYNTPVPSHGGALVGAAPQTKLQAPQNWNVKTINKWIFGKFYNVKPPRTNAKPPY